jgi:serine protease Do
MNRKRTRAVGTWSLLALLVAAPTAWAEGKQNPNQAAAKTARNVSQQARSVAGYAEKVADHYDTHTSEAAVGDEPEATEAEGEHHAPLPAPAAGNPGEREKLHGARDGVVTIERNGKVLGVGSVLAGDGRVLTALSNLGHGNDIDVRYADGSVSRVRVGHSDRAWDVALLVPQNGRWTQGLRASRLKPQQLGSDVHLFGLHNKRVQLSRTILQGQRTLVGGDSALLRDAITIGSKLQGADVGSPIVDKNGDVVAMVARACAPAETEQDESVCSPVPYGVPVGALRAFLSTAPANAVAPAPWLGVRGVADQVGTVRGVRLLRVDKESPAAAAGLQGSPIRERSDLVVAVNGAPVSTPDELGTEVNKYAVGESVQLLLLGNGKFREVSMTLRAAPTKPQPPTPGQRD